MKQETTEQPAEKPIVTRGHYIDFTPRRRKPAQTQYRPQPRPRSYAYTDPQIIRPQPRPEPQSRPEPQMRSQQITPPPVEPQEEVITQTFEEIERIEDVNYGVIEEYHAVSETTIAKPEPVKEPEAPDNNRYSLGGKSPFLESVTVEKRPLSNNIPPKNIYTKPPVAEAPKPPLSTVVKPESKKSKVPLVLLIVATVIVGAAVGAGAYFFFFQGQ